MMSEMKSEKNHSGLSEGTARASASRDWRTAQKPVGTSGLWAEVWILDRPDTKQDCSVLGRYVRCFMAQG